MPYKAFISSSNNEEGNTFAYAIRDALFEINELTFLGVNLDDHERRWNELRLNIDTCDVFIGVYNEEYGYVPEGDTFSLTERAYRYAASNDKPLLIFMAHDAMGKANTPQKAFLRDMMERHIIHKFKDVDELKAKVKLAMESFKETMPRRRPTIEPPNLGLREEVAPPMPPSPSRGATREAEEAAQSQTISFSGTQEELDATIERAIDLAQDDLEQIVRRALELHDARRQVTEDDTDGLIQVRPLWGEPVRRSQFESDIFMVMPFRERFNKIYENIIIPTTAELNLTIKRGDDFASTQGSIIGEVWAALNACRLVIAETTDINANVYYELGIAHTLGKPVILITQQTDFEQVPFDIRHLRFIVYSDTIEGGKTLEEELKKTIIWLMNDLEEQNADDNAWYNTNRV